MLTEKLLPAIGSLRVDALELCADRILLQLSVTQAVAACPRCHQSSGRVHSRYTRHFADVPWAGRAVCHVSGYTDPGVVGKLDLPQLW